MGLVKLFSGCGCECKDSVSESSPPPVRGNQDPTNYQVLFVEEIGTYLIATLVYHDCTNYEGRKILLFYNVTEEQLLKQERIDPHFCDSKEHISPIARFEPTERGLIMARTLAASF
jgi:hypothetical protein